MIDMIFKQGRSLNDVSKVLFTVKSNVHKMEKKAIKTIAKIYDELKKGTKVNDREQKENESERTSRIIKV